MSHIAQHRLLTQAEYDVLEKLDALRKTRGIADQPTDQRDTHVILAAANIMAIEEIDHDDNEQHGWGPKECPSP